MLPRAWNVQQLHAALHTQCTNTGQGSAASMPVAAHAQPAARLLVELRALERQRRGNALLGCCLRLGVRLNSTLVHLGISAQSGTHHEQDRRFHILQLIPIIIAHAAWRMAFLATPLAFAAHTVHQHRPGQCSEHPMTPHMHSQLRACLSSSARSSASAAATRCSVATSASARASVRAWSTWAQLLDQQGIMYVMSRTAASKCCSSSPSPLPMLSCA